MKMYLTVNFLGIIMFTSWMNVLLFDWTDIRVVGNILHTVVGIVASSPSSLQVDLT